MENYLCRHLYTEKLNLTSAQDYKYLGQSNCYSINGVDDAERFHSVKVILSFTKRLSYSSSSLDFYSLSRLILKLFDVTGSS